MNPKKSGGLSGLFGGMKVKGPAMADKSKVAQTQTHLTITTTDHRKSSEADIEKIKPVIQKQDKKQKIQVETIESKISSQDHNDNHDEQPAAFELPPLSKPKSDKSLQEQQKTKAQSKKSSEENDKEEIKQIDNVPKPAVVEIEENKSVSESVKKNLQKKQFASECNYQFEKKKDRKQSNPFLNQIKKNTTNMDRENQNDIDDLKPGNVNNDIKLAKKSEKENVMELIKKSHILSIKMILKQKDLKQSIIEIAGNLQENRDELALSTQKQCECVEKEDYQEAENYQNKIQNLQKKIEEQEVELEKRQEEFYKNEHDQLKEEKEQHFESKKIIRQIKLAELQLQEEESNLRRKKAELEQNEDVKIEFENKKITRLQNDIKFQSEQIGEFEKKYTSDLNSRKDPLTSELDSLQKSKLTLEEEIAELEKKLLSKKESLKEVNNRVTQIKKEIKSVDDNFKEEGVKLQERKKKLELLEKQKKELQSHVKQLEASKKSESEKISKKCEELQNEGKNLSLIEQEMEEKEVDFEEKMEDRRVKVDNFIHSTKSLRQFEAKHKTKKDMIKDFEFKKANAAAQANSLQQKRSQTKQRIPKLEQQQKSMAESKNFKGANMKKAEIKEAQEQIEALGKKIEQCFVKEKELDQKMMKMKSEQSTHIEQENEIRKSLAISQFKFDIYKWEELKDQVNWLKKFDYGTDKKEKDTFKQYQEILNEQIENLVQEIKYIGEEYSLDLSFLDPKKEPPKQSQPAKITENATKSPVKQKQTENQAKQEITNPPEQSHDTMEAQDNEQEREQEGDQDLHAEKEEEGEVEVEAQEQPQMGQINHQVEPEEDGGYVPLQLD